MLSFPVLTADGNNQSRLIGTLGDDADNIAPIAIGGDRLHQSVSSIIPKIVATKHDLPALAEDPLGLDDPPGATADRLHYVFDDPERTPVIAGVPATFSVPDGIKPPFGWAFTSGQITEADFACAAGRAWVDAIAHIIAHHGGRPIHTDPNTFNADDLDLGPFNGLEMAPQVQTSYEMLHPEDEQYGFVRTIANEAIQARRQAQAAANPVTPPTTGFGGRENEALERQARVMSEIVKATIASVADTTKDTQSRTDREAGNAVVDVVARYQLMLAEVVEVADPHNPDVTISKVALPAISDMFMQILDTTKLSTAVRTLQEQFSYHLENRARSRDFHDLSTNLDPKALDGPFVTALKTGQWASKPLTFEPGSIKDKLGTYHFAPPRTGSVAYEARIANGSLVYRQEDAGEARCKVATKAHDLDHTGRLESETDMHNTISNMGAVLAFIAENATKSELWKMICHLHNIWLGPEGKTWLTMHLKSHKHIVAAVILEFQQVVALYVKIGNNLEYRQAVKAKKQISPKAYDEANERARNIVRTMGNLIPGLTLGNFIIEPIACRNFYVEDKETQDKRRADQKAEDREAARRERDAAPRAAGGGGGGRRDEGRTSAPPQRDNNRNNNSGAPARGNAPPDISAEQVAILRGRGLIKYNGRGRCPQPVDILETNGANGLSRLCVPFLARDYHCRWGDNCKQKHVRSVKDLSAPNEIKFQTFVQNHTQLEMVTPGTNP